MSQATDSNQQEELPETRNRKHLSIKILAQTQPSSSGLGLFVIPREARHQKLWQLWQFRRFWQSPGVQTIQSGPAGGGAAPASRGSKIGHSAFAFKLIAANGFQQIEDTAGIWRWLGTAIVDSCL
jgi:hypothetical protein